MCISDENCRKYIMLFKIRTIFIMFRCHKLNHSSFLCGSFENRNNNDNICMALNQLFYRMRGKFGIFCILMFFVQGFCGISLQILNAFRSWKLLKLNSIQVHYWKWKAVSRRQQLQHAHTYCSEMCHNDTSTASGNPWITRQRTASSPSSGDSNLIVQEKFLKTFS